MEKEFEALKTIKIKCHPNSNPSPIVDEALEIVEQAITELKTIKEAKPSEALECLDKVNNYLNDVYDYKEIKEEIQKDINAIKQALTELNAIKESNPSEALEELFKTTYFGSKEEYDKINKCYNIIKQALLIKSKKEQAFDIYMQILTSDIEDKKLMPYSLFKATEEEFGKDSKEAKLMKELMDDYVKNKGERK